MTKKRNFAETAADTRSGGAKKRQKTKPGQSESQGGQHAVLKLHYEYVSTLREYILERFPNSSQSRKQRLKAVPVYSDSFQLQADDVAGVLMTWTTASIESALASTKGAQIELSKLLDTTVIGYDGSRTQGIGKPAVRKPYTTQNIQQLSQRLRSTIRGSSGQAGPSQHEIVDFAVGHLINSVYHGARFQPHVLCNGFTRSPPSHGPGDIWSNGLFCTFPNCNAAMLQRGAWPALLKLLGKDGDHVILDLLFHCAIFVPLERGRNNLCQISGIQLSELPLLQSLQSTDNVTKSVAPRGLVTGSSVINKSSSIKIIRNRMFYARPGLNGKGAVRLGLQHIHVFNRYPDAMNPQHVAHVLKYIFPRQFGLHNVFTCKPDRRDTVQVQNDYTMREQEIMISLRRQRRKLNSDGNPRTKLPKRMRGAARLVARILRRHTRCAYVELLRHYCPVKHLDLGMTMGNSIISTTPSKSGSDSRAQAPILHQGEDVVDLATSPAQVFAFCRSVLLRLLPAELLDKDVQKSPNLRLLLKSVLGFVQSRKRETLDLHSIIQGFKTSDITWLVPSGMTPESKMSQSDYSKRRELLEELLYYIFDSLLIPLIRSNFHVTESNNHVHQLFYFRHDIWRQLTQPCLHELQLSMFEVYTGSRKDNAKLQTMPYGHLRLVPKGSTFRPIMNLKRRPMIKQDGRWILGPRSVNTMLKPVYSMIKHEKSAQPGLAGSSMFSVDEIYPKLKQFSEMLEQTGRCNEKLCFAKVDVTQCFDTIPQNSVLELMENICDQESYCLTRHAEISARHIDRNSTYPLTRRFRDREPARALEDIQSFSDYIASQYGDRRKNTIFIEQGAPNPLERNKLMDLLRSHISSNNVKVGKKFLKQKRGIPQGSILSSILCNFFYGQFERECLDFLHPDNSLLLRLLDDFLLITLDQSSAVRFLEIMHAGNAKYGITIKPGKSLTNIPSSTNSLLTTIPTNNTSWFPYCGKSIHTATLSISPDRNRHLANRITESISLERSHTPGSAFHRLALDALKRNLHAQYTDTTLNTPSTVLTTLFHDFTWSALRMHAYIRGLGPRLRPRTDLILRTLSDMGNMTYALMNARSKIKDDVGYACTITQTEVKYLLAKAFGIVFRRKNSAVEPAVLHWLDESLVACLPRNHRVRRRLIAAAAAAAVGDSNGDGCGGE